MKAREHLERWKREEADIKATMNSGFAFESLARSVLEEDLKKAQGMIRHYEKMVAQEDGQAEA